jgi:hypothetical protein
LILEDKRRVTVENKKEKYITVRHYTGLVDAEGKKNL